MLADIAVILFIYTLVAVVVWKLVWALSDPYNHNQGQFTRRDWLEAIGFAVFWPAIPAIILYYVIYDCFKR